MVDTNQQFYAALEELGVNLQLIVPALWKGDLTGELRPPSRWEDLRAQLTPVPVIMPGNVPLHAYHKSSRAGCSTCSSPTRSTSRTSRTPSTFQGALANRLSVRRPFRRNNQNIAQEDPGRPSPRPSASSWARRRAPI